MEDEGDHVVHDIFGRLRSTFITPFDPEDIQALATSLDDFLDGIDDVTFPDRCVPAKSCSARGASPG